MNFKIHTKNRTEIAEQSKLQKERNRELFLNRLKYKEDLQPESTESPTSPTEQKEKQLRRKVQKELEGNQKKLTQKSEMIREQAEKLKKYEQELAELKYQQWKNRDQYVQLKNLETELMQREVGIEAERKKRMEMERRIEQLELEREKGEKGGKKLVNLSNQLKQLKQSNRTLRKQLENHDLLTSQKYGNVEQEVENLQKEVQIYRKREKEIHQNPMYLMSYMKQHMTDEYLPDLIGIVESFITKDNLHYFYRGQHNLFYLLMRRVNLLSYHSKNRKKPYSMKKTKNANDKERLGYLIYENDTWMFVDTTQSDHSEIYQVIENRNEEVLTVDRPVRAILQDEGVDVDKYLTLESSASAHTVEKQKGGKAQTRAYMQFGNFKILVIGSRFMSDYKHRLEKHGCTATLHNPYEESFEVLKGKISKSEIILVCERHIPHSVWDHVDKKQPFVSALKQDSKDLIATFAYLTLKRCELV